METKTVKELKALCSSHGIKTTGNKADLLARLRRYRKARQSRRPKRSAKAIRHVGCSKIDFLGSTRSSVQNDLKMTLRVAQSVADAARHGSPSDKKQLAAYCRTRDWMTSSQHGADESQCRTIPLQATVAPGRRQYVFGRMSNLRPYYACQSKFITLDSQDWDNLYQVNDMFVYCATTMANENFPLRLVFDSTDGIHSRDPKTGFMNYDDNVLSIPHLFNPTAGERVHILSREVCQISRFFGLHLYQSREYPHIFFASKKNPAALRAALQRHKLAPVFIS